MIEKLDIDDIIEKHKQLSMKRTGPEGGFVKDVVTGALNEMNDKINEIIDILNSQYYSEYDLKIKKENV